VVQLWTDRSVLMSTRTNLRHLPPGHQLPRTSAPSQKLPVGTSAPNLTFPNHNLILNPNRHLTLTTDVKTFFYVFLLWLSFYVFNVFFIFQTFFIFKKGWQSSEQQADQQEALYPVIRM